MIITKRWLKLNEACTDGIDWVEENAKNLEGVELVKRLMNHRLDWANWLIVRIMTRPQYLEYAIYAAEQVIDIFEKEYPEDKRPRDAINAAKAVLENDTPHTRAAAWAARAAWSAWAARAAWSAGAARAAWSAGDAARAAGSAGDAAWSAGDAARAAGSAGDAMLKKILNHGLEIIKNGSQNDTNIN